MCLRWDTDGTIFADWAHFTAFKEMGYVKCTQQLRQVLTLPRLGVL